MFVAGYILTNGYKAGFGSKLRSQDDVGTRHLIHHMVNGGALEMS